MRARTILPALALAATLSACGAEHPTAPAAAPAAHQLDEDEAPPAAGEEAASGGYLGSGN